MPCRVDDYPSGPTPAEVKADRELKRTQPLLCSACRALARLGYDFDENPELSEWWDKHVKEDTARVAEEERMKEKVAWEKRQVKLALRKSIADLTGDEKLLLKKYKYL
jgi:hypothetical protein